MTNLLYVCDGNISRSPAAEIITRVKAKERGIENLVVESAGLVVTTSEDGSTPVIWIKEEMAKAVGNIGYGYHFNHKARIVNDNTFNQQDLVLCFENRQVREILRLMPSLAGRVWTLTSYGGICDADIKDPKDFVGDIKGYQLLKHLPFLLDSKYLRGRIVDPSDEKRLSRLYEETAKEIAVCVGRALVKMLGECQTKR